MLDRMVEHARREAPNECVGVLGARDGEAAAAGRGRERRRSPLAYEIAPQELLRVHDRLDEDDLEVGAIYHSHTRTEPVPSQTDINLAFYPEAVYIIVGLAGGEPDVRAFRIVDGEVSQTELEVAVSQALLCPACETPHGRYGALLPRLRAAARAPARGARGAA